MLGDPSSNSLNKKANSLLEKAFHDTPLPDRGWTFADIAQFVFASVQGRAREQLEADGMLASAKAHRNGVDWVSGLRNQA